MIVSCLFEIFLNVSYVPWHIADSYCTIGSSYMVHRQSHFLLPAEPEREVERLRGLPLAMVRLEKQEKKNDCPSDVTGLVLSLLLVLFTKSRLPCWLYRPSSHHNKKNQVENVVHWDSILHSQPQYGGCLAAFLLCCVYVLLVCGRAERKKTHVNDGRKGGGWVFTVFHCYSGSDASAADSSPTDGRLPLLYFSRLYNRHLARTKKQKERELCKIIKVRNTKRRYSLTFVCFCGTTVVVPPYHTATTTTTTTTM
jgi:hypothetical protein